MVLRRATGRGQPRLDPIRWPFSLRRATVLRTATVLALLATAVTLLYVEPPAGTCRPVAGSAVPSAGPPEGAGQRPEGAGQRPAEGGAGWPTAGEFESTDSHDRHGSDGPLGRHARLPAGLVGVAVVPAEPAVLGMLSAGDRVDLLTTGPPAAGHAGRTTPPPGSMLARNALVMATPTAADPAAGGLYLAVQEQQARAVASAPEDTRFAVVLRGQAHSQ